MASFVEGSAKGEKVFDGVVFPKTLLPPPGLEKPSVDDLVELVKKNSDWLWDILQNNGAAFIRGFSLETAEDFGRVIEATGWDEFRYRGAVVRKSPVDRVFTANEAPIEWEIGFHHEMALISVHPAKIIFFCAQPSPEGGETPVVRSDVVAARLEERLPEVAERLQKEGIGFSHHRAEDTWKRLLKTDNKAEAEKTAVENLYGCKSMKFNEDGSADIFYGPFNPMRVVDGKKVMFNTIVGYVTEQADLNAAYGAHDGELIPKEVLDVYHEILAENAFYTPWEKGDVLFINNRLCQHGRRPGTPPRLVLVSVCE